jgi:putative acyl-CoA dehydrogenase
MDANQPAPFSDVNLFTGDRVLRQVLEAQGLDLAGHGLVAFGAVAGSAEIQHLARLANEFTPRLHAYDRIGERLDEVEYHPAYHRLMALSAGQGLTFGAFEPGTGHLARAAGFYLAAQMEAGHCCPVTMTNAALAVLRESSGLAADLARRAMVRDYDPRFLPAADKRALTFGMGMTERQGGSDVRTNTTRAVPAGDHHLVHGEKWFMSAPMSDAFLILAQAPAGLSCFLLPRWQPDGRRNAIHFRRLKDKLGNRSNASSEVVFEGAHGLLLGAEGRGIATIIEMVTLTRLDCAVSSAGLARFALAVALNHCRQRIVFGRPLIEQPLMRQVLADLALEVEAATALVFRLARAFDNQREDPAEQSFTRLMTPAIKYWVCGSLPAFAFEAMECLGGNGYVEDWPLARLYREAPINAIWEGSGNIMCLDVQRALRSNPEALERVLDQSPLASSAERGLLQPLIEAGSVSLRRDVERLVHVVAASLLARHAPGVVVDAYVRTRLETGARRRYGLETAEIDALIERAMPEI